MEIQKPRIMLLISITLLQLFCCVKDITMSTLCGGQLCVAPIDGFCYHMNI